MIMTKSSTKTKTNTEKAIKAVKAEKAVEAPKEQVKADPKPAPKKRNFAPRMKPMLPEVKVKPPRAPKPKGKASPGRKPVSAVNSPKTKRDVPDNVVSKRGGLINGVGKSGKRMPAPIIEENFAAEYLVDLDGKAAYLRVCPHVAPESARTKAYELLTRDTVQAHIKRLNGERLKRTGINADETLKRLHAHAFGDRTAISAVHVGCCRYCWGIDGRYQYSDGEYKDAQSESDEKNAMLLAADKPPIEFDGKGGPGFRASRDPNPECAICSGDGESKPVIKDTRKMDASALSLFQGAKQGKNGTEVDIVQMTPALTNLMRHQGLFEADNKQIKADAVPPEVLAELALRREKAKENQRKVLADRRGDGFTGD